MRNRIRRQTGSYVEILRTIWENRRRPRYAWRILRRGVCDGCALGTNGLRDWTMDGIHLCWIRLNLLHLNTMAAFPPTAAADAAALRARSERDLRRMGRIPAPLLRRRGEAGFRPVGWDAAMGLMAERLRGLDPRRLAFYLVSRGTVNETYYVAQKVARFLGTNHIDNSARVCHSPSTVALKHAIGLAGSTCSYRDLLETDLVVLLGSDVANNQPVVMKYLHLAKKRGTKVAVVNPVREPGLDRYWVPSAPGSALFGTKVCDAWFPIRVGGDIPFLHGVLKHLAADGAIDRAFVDAHTQGWEEMERLLDRWSFEELESRSGATRDSMRRFAALYGEARTAVFVWSMGITMHRHGVDNVRAIANLALARGMVGRAGTGLMAIRGHSGVQGGSEMGCVPNQFPGGEPVGPEGARRLATAWGFPVPDWKGAFVADQIEAAARGEIDFLYCVGSNLAGVLPDPDHVAAALGRIPFRVHHDLVLNPQMFLDPADAVLVLPATTRYEMPGGNTETTTERRVILNPEIPGPRVAEARDEWRVLVDLAKRVRPERADRIDFPGTSSIREEIARVIPTYAGIQTLRNRGDQFQWGGARLCEGGRFGTADGRARFAAVEPPDGRVPAGRFRLTTRRGMQFNSMVFRKRDSLLGQDRDEVVVAAADLERLGIREGAAVLVRNETGEFRGRARAGPVVPGTVLMLWPEANVLIPRGVTDPQCGIPAYRDAIVDLVPQGSA